MSQVQPAAKTSELINPVTALKYCVQHS